MTVTIKQETIGNKYIYIQQQKFSSAYEVGTDVIYDSCYATTYDEARIYPTLAKAKRRFNDLRRRYKDEDCADR